MPDRSPDDVLAELLEGNARFVAQRALHPHQSAVRCAEVAGGQHPAAVVVGCSDSRVPPEIVFDQGIGDLFVIRTAGHVVDSVALGSIQYAVEHLDVPLVIVLAHSSCGAVTAAVEGVAADGHLNSVLSSIQPAVEQAGGEEGGDLARAIEENARLVAAAIAAGGPAMAEGVEAGTLKVVAAVYDLSSGVLSVLG
jgi:carbonic anhydrase